jgi:type II secretory pathway component PulL
MINLLPGEVKDSYRYARSNVVLRRWVIIFVLALVGLGALSTYGLLNIQQSTTDYEKRISSKEKQFQDEKYGQAQKQIQDISNSFKLAVKVLGQEVLFSQLLKQIAATIPANANLTGLTISQTTGGIDITAVATDYATASQVQVNLADPNNKIFSKADIVSIKCGDSTDPNFPCTVTVRALFSQNNPFLFINSKGSTKS